MSKLGHWRTDPEEELARIIHRDELTTFWNSNIDIVIGPGETLVWIKDGKIPRASSTIFFSCCFL